MAERNCKKCFHYKACKEIASHNGYGDICYTESQCKNFIFIDDVLKVVRCRECIHRDPEDKKCDGSFQAKGGIFPMSDDDFCSYGERRS